MSGNKLFMELNGNIRSLETKMKFVRKAYLISGRKSAVGQSDRSTVFPVLRYVLLIKKEGSNLR
jgi:hypothetical protein